MAWIPGARQQRETAFRATKGCVRRAKADESGVGRAWQLMLGRCISMGMELGRREIAAAGGSAIEGAN